MFKMMILMMAMAPYVINPENESLLIPTELGVIHWTCSVLRTISKHAPQTSCFPESQACVMIQIHGGIDWHRSCSDFSTFLRLSLRSKCGTTKHPATLPRVSHNNSLFHAISRVMVSHAFSFPQPQALSTLEANLAQVFQRKVMLKKSICSTDRQPSRYDAWPITVAKMLSSSAPKVLRMSCAGQGVWSMIATAQTGLMVLLVYHHGMTPQPTSFASRMQIKVSL